MTREDAHRRAGQAHKACGYGLGPIGPSFLERSSNPEETKRMGLTTGNFPPVDPATFMQTPYRERIKTLSRHWVEYGFGAPQITALIYIAKLLFFYALGGVLAATLTSNLDPLHPATWWDEPIVYQKRLLWTVLLETFGVAGSWGPLTG